MQNIVNLIGKFFVLVFIGILIVGLVFWGIGDVIKGQGNQIVAEIGNQTITSYDIERQVSSQKNRLMNSGLKDFNEEFEEFLKKTALTQLINTKLLENELSNLGIEFENSFIIKKDFSNEGKFDEEALQAQIAGVGNEDLFIKEYVRDRKLDIIESSLTSITPLDNEYAKLFYKFEKQNRDVIIYSFDKSAIPSIETPDNKALEEFYNTNKENYRQPEFRNISYILLDKNSINIPPKDKKIEDILYEKANALLDKLAEGASFEEAATELNLKISAINFINNEGKDKNNNNITLPEIEGFLPTIFALAEGEASELLETKDGSTYAIIKINQIIESDIEPLNKVKDLVIADYNKNMLASKLYQKAKKLKADIEKSVISEDSLKNIIGVSINKKSGINRQETKIANPFLNLIFSTPVNKFSEIYVDGKNVKFAKVTKINYPEKIDEMELFNVKSYLQDQISQEIMMQYIASLAGKYKIKQN